MAAATMTAIVGGTLSISVLDTTQVAQAVGSTESSMCYNPMDKATPVGEDALTGAGFTIWTSGDATFSNSETEGSIAVGGTATFSPLTGGQYVVMHQSAGNGAYSIPTIDGNSTRVLLNNFGAASTVVQVKEEGSQSDADKGVAKIIQPTPGYIFGESFTFGGATTYFPEKGTNMSPQLESEAAAWDGLTGNPSMQAKNSFESYFPNNSGKYLAQDSGVDWKTATADTNNDKRTVTLDQSGPNQIDFSALKGASKFKFSARSTSQPLIIRVSQEEVVDGTLTIPSYINDGKTDPNGVGMILWDLSGVTGAVSIDTPVEAVRGSIYAPAADIKIPTKRFEGQVIAKTFASVASGEENHTNLFKGQLCLNGSSQVGGFSLSKVLSGVDASVFPEGTTFGVTASWTQDGASKSQVFELPVDGSVVEGPQDLPVGTVVSFSEAKPPEVEGYSFEGVVFSPGSVTVADRVDAAVRATNTYVKQAAKVGGFSLSKVLSGVDASVFPEGTTFGVTASWTQDGASKSQVFELPVDGSVVEGPQDLPVGTVVSFSEAKPPEVEGYSFEGVEFSPKSVTVADGGDAAVTATNTYSKQVAKTGAFSITKSIVGAQGVDRSFSFSYLTDTGLSGTVDVKAGQTWTSGSLPVGTVVTVSETGSTSIDGYDFGGVAFSGEGVTTSQDGKSVTLSISDGATVELTATNTYSKQVAKVGGFSLKKVVSGVDAADVPAGTVFSVTASWSQDGVVKSQVFQLDGKGTVVEGPQDLPVGTVVSFSEVKAPEIAGYTFSGVEFSPKSVTVADGGDAAVTATNTYSKRGLAHTGFNGGPALGAAGLALLLGGALAVASAKRKRS